MRRIDRKISDEETFSILINGEYGVLSTVSNDGNPYGIPLNYCVIENEIFFHCATNELKTIDKLNDKTKVFKIKIKSITGKACKK